MKICAYVIDLMDRSKFPAGTTFVRRAEQLDPEADVIVVDLSRRDALEAVAALRVGSSTARIVAYGSHVERDLLASAQAAGCDSVLSRSAFFADVAAALE